MCNNWLQCLLFFCSSSSQLQQQLLDLRSEDYNIRKLFFYMCGTLTNQARREEWVSCVVLICFTLCIPTSALPARPLPVVSGKPHGAKSYTRTKSPFSDTYLRIRSPFCGRLIVLQLFFNKIPLLRLQLNVKKLG